ncbi:MAG: head-tail adaptor protein [Hyphomonadaceae bacterium]|nr:head-tail adaptor protein [Hyphomonadaceae bacterium]
MAFVPPGAGELNVRVTLKQPVRTETASGGFTRADTTLATRFAKVAPAKWSQKQMAMQMQQRVDLCITLRYEDAIATALLKGEAVATFTDKGGRSRTVAVKTVVDPENMGRWLELACEDGAPT